MISFLMLPFSNQDLCSISEIVRKNESFVALLEGDLYSIQQYHLSYGLGNFTAILDRNVYTRILAILRHQTIAPHALADHRWAAAVLAFSQIAKFTYNYGASLQEFASKMGGAAAIDDFKSFYRADNCDPQAWIDYAVGKSSSLDISSIMDLPDLDNVPSAYRFETPIYEFRINYIFVLKIIVLSFEKSPPEKVMMDFLTWMKDEFIMSAGAIHLANLWFSPARFKKMLKKRTVSDAKNIAWDLATLQNWRMLAIEGVQKSEPVLLITRDKVMKYIAKRFFASDFDEYRTLITEPWQSAKAKGELIFLHYLKVDEEIRNNSDTREKPSDGKLESITQDLEKQITELKKN